MSRFYLKHSEQTGGIVDLDPDDTSPTTVVIAISSVCVQPFRCQVHCHGNMEPGEVESAVSSSTES